MKTFKKNLLKILKDNRTDGLTRKLGKDNRIMIKKARINYIAFLEESESEIISKLIWRDGDLKSFEQLTYDFDMEKMPLNLALEFRPQMTFSNSKIKIMGIHIFKFNEKSKEFFSDAYFLGGLKHFRNIHNVNFNGVAFNLYYTIENKLDAKITMYYFDSVLWYFDMIKKKFIIVGYDIYELLNIISEGIDMDVEEFTKRVDKAKTDMGFLAVAMVTIRRAIYSYFVQKQIAPIRISNAHVERGKVIKSISSEILHCGVCNNPQPSLYLNDKCFYGNHKLQTNIIPMTVLFKKEI